MKKLAVLLFVMASVVIIVPAAEARTISAGESAINETQWRDRQDRYQQRRARQNQRYQRRDNRRDRRNDRRNNNRRYQNRGYYGDYYGNRRYENRSRVRTFYQTRTVRRGRALYRETYRVMHLPNGRVNSRLVNRVLLRRY